MEFWIIAGAIALGVAVLVLRPLVQSKASTAPRSDVGFYKAQLAEIDRDLERGVLSEEQAQETRLEVSRRLLAADKETHSPTATAPRRDVPAAISVGVLLLAAAGVSYIQLGADGLRDAPRPARLAAGVEAREGRKTQQEAELPSLPQTQGVSQDYLDMIERLREVAGNRPDDIEGQRLLARHEAQLGNFTAAARAQERVVDLAGTEATLDERSMLLDLWVFAANGYVSREAGGLAQALLKEDPNNPAALFHLGLLYEETDRADVAFRLWRDLIEAAPDSSHADMARRGVTQAAMMSGVDYTPPRAPALPGPTAEQMQDAEGMSAEDRQQMIEGMVEQLNERLATEGGTVDEWARLISALGVLGQTDRARAIWTEAQQRFAADPAALELIQQAGQSAGLQ